MPRPLSVALCGLIKSDLQAGCDLLTLKSRHRISDKKARTMKKLFDETGDVLNTHRRKGSGRPTKLKHEHIERLKGFLNEHPEAFLKDMCLFMEIEFQLELTESTMQRACKRIGWSLKKKPRPRDELGFWRRTLPRDENDNAVRGVRKGKTRDEDYGKKMSYTARKKLLEKTRDFVKDYMSQPRFDASHDYDHVLRVIALSMEILRVEQNTFRKIVFDGLVIELVALMHDIDDHKYRPPTNETGSYPSPPANADPQIQPDPSTTNPNNFTVNQPTLQHPSAPPNIDPNLQSSIPAPSIVQTYLLQLGWPEAVAYKVGAITPYISYTAETTNKPGFAAALAQYPELAIVQDADRLDAIGSTGIGRAFTYGGAKAREGGMAQTLAHFGEKLAKLEAMMKTGEGRRLSVVRAERLRIFARWWQDEMRKVGMAGEDGMEWANSASPWASQSLPEVANNPVISPRHAVIPPNQPPSGRQDQATPQPHRHSDLTMEGVQTHQAQGVPSTHQPPSQDTSPMQGDTDNAGPGRQLLEAIAASQ